MPRHHAVRERCALDEDALGQSLYRPQDSAIVTSREKVGGLAVVKHFIWGVQPIVSSFRPEHSGEPVKYVENLKQALPSLGARSRLPVQPARDRPGRSFENAGEVRLIEADPLTCAFKPLNKVLQLMPSFCRPLWRLV
jgi:hypothetical protein